MSNLQVPTRLVCRADTARLRSRPRPVSPQTPSTALVSVKRLVQHWCQSVASDGDGVPTNTRHCYPCSRLSTANFQPARMLAARITDNSTSYHPKLTAWCVDVCTRYDGHGHDIGYVCWYGRYGRLLFGRHVRNDLRFSPCFCLAPDSPCSRQTEYLKCMFHTACLADVPLRDACPLPARARLPAGLALPVCLRASLTNSNHNPSNIYSWDSRLRFRNPDLESGT